MKIITKISLLVIALLSTSIVLSQQIALEQDGVVVASLKKNGADLSKLHSVDFFLIFLKKSDADSAAIELKAQGFSINGINQIRNSERWEIHA
jgi:hypothetical protein